MASRCKIKYTWSNDKNIDFFIPIYFVKKCGKGNNIVFEAALMSKYFNI